MNARSIPPERSSEHRSSSHRLAVVLALLISGAAPWLHATVEAPPSGPSASASSVEAAEASRLADLQKLAARVQAARETLGLALRRGEVPPEGMAERARHWLRRLDRMTASTGGSGGTQDALLRAKVTSVRLLVLDIVRNSQATEEAGIPDDGLPPTPTAERWIPATARGPSNDECAAAQVIGLGTVAGETMTASPGGGASCGVSTETPDVWFRYTATASGELSLSTAGSDFDTVLSVHTACPETPSSIEVACNDDRIGVQAGLSFWAQEGDTYLVRLSGAAGATGNFVLTLGPAARIEGTVTDAVTSLPVAGTRVTSYVGGRPTWWTAASAVTADDGSYALTAEKLDRYLVAAADSEDGYVDEVFDDVSCVGGVGVGCTGTDAVALDLTGPGTVATADFGLRPAAGMSGAVVDGDTGIPLTGWIVVNVYDAWADLVASVTANGPTWQLKELVPGAYRAAVRVPGYQSELFENIPCLGWCDVPQGTPIEVREGQTTGGVSFSPVRLGSISGTVVNATSGAPLRYAYVRVYDAAGTQYDYYYTSSDGTYTVGGLPPGTYYVKAERDCYGGRLYRDVACAGEGSTGCALTDGTPIVLGGDHPDVSGIDFSLHVNRQVTGRVTDSSTGQPLAGVRVAAWAPATMLQYTSATSGADGTYSLACLAPQSYLVAIENGLDHVRELYDDIPCPGDPGVACDASLGTLVEVDADRSATDVDFALQAGSTLHGRLRDSESHTPLGSVWVYLWNPQGEVDSIRSAGDGTYSFRGLAPGRYFVRASNTPTHVGALYDGIPCPTTYDTGCDPRGGTPIDITAGPPHDIAGIDLDLQRKGAITGRVTARADGSPIAHVRVSVWNDLGDPAETTHPYGETDADGNYSVMNLPGSTYYVTAGPASAYLGELYAGTPCDLGPPASCTVTAGTPVRVELGHLTERVDFTLRSGASISGAVRAAATGQPISGYAHAYRDDGFVRSSACSFDGSYEITGLAPGSYSVVATDYGYVPQVYDGFDCAADDACGPGSGTPVELAEGGGRSGIDFSLKRQGRISGVVTDASTGNLLPGVSIRFYHDDGSYAGATNVASTGLYDYPLMPGSYSVETSSYDYENELFRDVPCGDSCPHGLAELVSVQPALTTRHVDFTLARLASVSGQVTDAKDGTPVPNTRVELRDIDGELLLYTTTDAGGAFLLRRLDAGSYYVVARPTSSSPYITELYDGVTCPGGDPTACLGSATPVPLDVGVQRTGVDLALAKTTEIAGTVTTNRTGLPVPASVCAYDTTTLESVACDTSSSTTGDFAIEHLPEGSYYLFVKDYRIVPELYDDIPCPGGLGTGCALSSGKPVEVSAATPPPPIQLRVDRRASLHGTVRDAATGRTLRADAVWLLDTDGKYLKGYTASSFTFENLEPGSYLLLAVRHEYIGQMFDGADCTGEYEESCDLGLATPIQLDLNDAIAGIDFALTPIPAVTATVTVTDALTGAPLDGSTVSFYDLHDYSRGWCATSVAGDCSVLLAPGTYHVTARHDSYHTVMYDGIICSSTCDVSKGTPFTVAPDGTSTLTFALPLQGPGVVGHVTTSGGAAVPMAVIDAWDANDGSWVSATTADGHGSFQLSVSKGSYYLSTDNGQGLMDEVYDDVACPDGPAYAGLCDPSLGAVVPVGDTLVTGIDFVLGAGPAIFADGFEEGLSPWSRTVGN